VRLEQSERFLRFRLAERAGQKFMEDNDVTPQRITPLLSLSGHAFEEGVEEALGSHFRTVHYAVKASQDHNRPDNNQEVIADRKNRTTFPTPPGGRIGRLAAAGRPRPRAAGQQEHRSSAEADKGRTGRIPWQGQVSRRERLPRMRGRSS
jgi:hypothetical protein